VPLYIALSLESPLYFFPFSVFLKVKWLKKKQKIHVPAAPYAPPPPSAKKLCGAVLLELGVVKEHKSSQKKIIYPVLVVCSKKYYYECRG
jgi:hypothetical protein